MILLLGNCQLQRMNYICKNNDIKCEYIANTDQVEPEFDEHMVLEAIAKADVVIAQPIFNEDNPLNHQVISRTAKNVVFFPYVFIDGIFSLSAAEIGSPYVMGQQCLSGYADVPFDRLVGDFQLGSIDFRNRERFQSSLKELERREKAVDCVPISDVIAENYESRRLLLTHNHPEKWLMDIMCQRLFGKMRWSYQSYDDSPHYQRVDYMFDAGETVLSPYDVERLNLEFPSDDQWWTTGRRLLARIWNERDLRVAK